MANELEVWLGEQRAGFLLDTAGRWSFVYHDEALSGSGMLPYPVSLALPRTRAAHHGPAVTAVFANLLPDGELRRRLAQSLGLSAANELGLLGRVGGDCPGAVRLLPPGQAALPGASRRLSEQDLRNAMAVLPTHPLLADADALGATLPGDFDKLPVTLEDGQVTLSSGTRISTHILKPARPGLRESVFNEAFVMALAGAAGLPVAPCRIIHGQLAVLCVTRVDRRTDGATRALHMEDLCQVAGLSASNKYEREGGLGLAEVVSMVRRFSCAPAQDIRHLLHWLLFSYLVGFGAGHAKQLAFLYESHGPRLAPFFGLWSTHVYGEMNHRLGFDVGGEDRPDWLTAARWMACAEATGVRPAYLLGELRRFAQDLPRLAAEQAELFQRRNGFANVIRQIRVLIEQRARQALVALEAEIPGATRAPTAH